jgi:CBS domain-containing protein
MEAAERTRESSLSSTVHTAPREVSVKDVARLMAARGVRAVVVVDGLEPVGLVTRGDLLCRVTASGADAAAVDVGAVMSTPLITASLTDTLPDAVDVMVARGIRQLPVLDDQGRLFTLLTLDDLLRLKLVGVDDLARVLAAQGAARAAAADAVWAELAAAAPDLPSGSAREERGPVPPMGRVARRSSVVPMVKRRRGLRFLYAIRSWLSRNRGFVLLVLLLSLLGAGAALTADYLGGVIAGYRPSSYEPKDDERVRYLERLRQERARGGQGGRAR